MPHAMHAMRYFILVVPLLLDPAIVPLLP